MRAYIFYHFANAQKSRENPKTKSVLKITTGHEGLFLVYRLEEDGCPRNEGDGMSVFIYR